MPEFFEGNKYDSADILKEIQTERMVYQINSSLNSLKASDKMKRGIEAITKEMENVQRIVYDRKKSLEEMEINLSEKKGKMKELQQELEHTIKRIETSAKKTLELETKANNITSALEKIKEATQEIDQKYLERSQNELINIFVKVTSDAEKAQSDLNAAKRMESVISKKLQEIEIDYTKLESETLNKAKEVDVIISNVSNTIQYIARSYDDIVDASKTLLKSAISMNTIHEEQNQQHNEVNDIKMAV